MTARSILAIITGTVFLHNSEIKAQYTDCLYFVPFSHWSLFENRDNEEAPNVLDVYPLVDKSHISQPFTE